MTRASRSLAVPCLILALALALGMGLGARAGPAPEASSVAPPAVGPSAASSQDLERNPSFLDAFSVYSYGKVATNASGAAVVFWNAATSGRFVARTWDNGVLTPAVSQPPLVLFSGTPAGGGIVATNLTINEFANLDVKVRGDRAYLSWVMGGPLVPRLGFTWVDLASVANAGDHTKWHSANGRTPPAEGAAWDQAGIDILPAPHNTTAPSVVATRDGRIVIASQHAPSLRLEVAYYDGASWRFGWIYPSGGFVGEPHLEIDDRDDLRLVFYDQQLRAILYATSPLGSEGLDPTRPESWRGASGVSGFDAVVARNGAVLYHRSYLTVDGDEVRVGALSEDKSTFYFNVLRGGSWLGGTGIVSSGWTIPAASSQARFPYTFFQWSRDASGESYLFYEQGGSVLATTWNGTAWSSPLALGSGSYQNVIGQSATRVPGAPLLVFSRQTSANKLVLFAVPTRAAPPDLQGPPVAPGSLGLVPDAFIAPATVALNGTLDDRATGGSPIAAAEFFLDVQGASGTGTPMSAVSPPAFGASNLTSASWTGTMDAAIGTHAIWVHGQDDAGNWGPFSSVPFTVLEPGVPTSSLAASWLGWTSVSEVDIAFTASAEAGLRSVSLWTAFSSDNASFGPWEVALTVPVSGSSYAGTVRMSLSDGPGWYQVRSVATDALDRSESLDAKPSSWVGYDGSAPRGTLSSVTYWSLTPSASLALSAADDVSIVRVALYLSTSADNASFASWVLAGEWAPGGPEWTHGWTASPGEGYHRAALVVQDAAGLTFNAARTATLGFGVDLAPPESGWTSPLPAYAAVSWLAAYTVRDSLGVANASLFVSRSPDRVSWTEPVTEDQATIVATSHDGTLTVVTGMLEGWLRVAVVAIDVAGRASEATASNVGEVAVDLVAPEVVLLNVTPGAWLRPSHRVQVSSSEPGVAEYRFEALTSWAPVPADGQIFLAALPDGIHVLSVQVRDSAGNLGTASATVQVDGQAPVLSLCPTPFTYADGRLVLCWSASDGTSGIASLVLVLDGTTIPLSSDATAWSGTVGPGAHRIEVRATDRAGNVGTVSGDLDLKVTPPDGDAGVAPSLIVAGPLLIGLVLLGASIAWYWRSSRRP